ncbi:hypothetical protein CL619_03465 [archaeon]|nr:hypothetical protein [archaeon]
MFLSLECGFLVVNKKKKERKMRQIDIRPQTIPDDVKAYFASTGVNLDDHFASYFETAVDSTLLSTDGIFPCIGGIFYRQGHLGLGHFDPYLEPLLEEIEENVLPRMNSYGTGPISCRFFTGIGFRSRPNGWWDYDRFSDRIKEIDLNFDEEGSRLFELLHNEMIWTIDQLQARLVGDDLRKVEIKVKYSIGPSEMFRFEI